MSILIKGMEMPESCWDCPIQVNPFCVLDLIELTDTEKRIRPDKCPLVEVPPHGRLIDADELYSSFIRMANEEWNKKCGGSWSDGFMESASIVEDAPTVIPSDKDGET